VTVQGTLTTVLVAFADEHPPCPLKSDGALAD
jgi:hypothetical protein